MSSPVDSEAGTPRVHGHRVQVDLVLGFGLYITVGFSLLCLPWMQADGGNGVLDNLFTAVSAVSTTGLTTVEMESQYTVLGQAVILALIQIGGLGFLTLGSFFYVTVRRGRLDRFHTAVGKANLDIPEGIDFRTFLRRAVLYTFACEAVGAAALYVSFGSDTERRLWTSVFHSVSAFCTAGFSTFSSSLEEFRGDVAISMITLSLSMLGALGFIVLNDVVATLRGRRQWSWTTKVIVLVTFSLLFAATAIIAVVDDGLAALPVGERLMASLFQAGSAITTVGFSTHPTAELIAGPALLIMVLMVIGASPSGTGGGVKTVRIATSAATAWSTVRQHSGIRLLGRQLTSREVRRASANLTLYLSSLVAGMFLLLLTETGSPFDIVFEAVSAQGTVGLSRGLTDELTTFGRIVVISLMIIGRLGALTFTLAVVRKDPKER